MNADAERQQRLFDWARAVLKRLGIERAIKQAKSRQELRRIVLDLESIEVALAIRDALNPASGEREAFFRGLKENHLKRILGNQFTDLKKDREKSLRRGGQGHHWSDDLILNKDGTVKPIFANLELILRCNPDWKGVLAYDEFAGHVVIRKRPQWPHWPEATPDTPWTDHHESLVRLWFQREAAINASLGDVGRAIQKVARDNSFHAARQYFNALNWDGTPRLDTWLVKYLGAEDTNYARAIGPRYMISAVARIFEPGCKVDHVLVLEGPQGKQKSEGLRILAIRDEWFTDRLSHVSSKDAALEVSAGVLIVEIAEMEVLTRASSSAGKAFITRRFDPFRPPYGRHMTRRKRQCVFAGTINPESGGYLKDATGARRFWPVACGVIERVALERDRDLLWAEAVHRYSNGEKWFLETPELEALATAEQKARFKVDAWHEPIRKWLGDRTDVSIWEVLEHALGRPPEQWTQIAQNRVAAILTHLEFSRHRPRKRTPEGQQERPNRYFRDPILGKSSPKDPDQSDRDRKVKTRKAKKR